VLAIPAGAALAAVETLLARGTRAFAILSGGFGERDAAGAERQRRLSALCTEHGAVLLGPNCMGLHVARPGFVLHAGFAQPRPEPGPAAVISQSGSMAEWCVRRLASRGVGVSLTVSLGNTAGVGAADLLAAVSVHLPEVRTTALYLESPREARAAAGAAVLANPAAVALLGGTSPAGAAAAGYHTGNREGPARAGFPTASSLSTVASPGAWVDLIELSVRAPSPKGTRVAVVTNAGGPAILAVDAFVDASAPRFSQALQAVLAGLAPPGAALGNPLDLLATAGPGHYARTIPALAASGEVDALLIVFMHPRFTAPGPVATAIGAALDAVDLPAVVCWMSEEAGVTGVLRGRGATVVADPRRAAQALDRWLADGARGGSRASGGEPPGRA
jgi:acetyltransferase